MQFDVTLAIQAAIPTRAAMLLQIEAAAMEGQQVDSVMLTLPPAWHHAAINADSGIGLRHWLELDSGSHAIGYQAQVEVNRAPVDLASLRAVPLHLLPGEVTPYLFESRYCTFPEIAEMLDDLPLTGCGGMRASEIAEWISGNISYTSESSNSGTTAADVVATRKGVCRDFAHLAIAMARASNIPARYVSGYGPRVAPQDFHAVAELWLADDSGRAGWKLLDATGMASAEDFAIIAVGRDAADCSFLTFFCESGDSSHEITITPRR